jgi:hypothetical protein
MNKKNIKDKQTTKKMELLTRKTGIWTSAIGIAIFLLNFLTYTLWKIDIDILGAVIFILGLVIMIAAGKTMKHSSKWLTREKGIWLCITGVVLTLILAYLPFTNGDVGGMFGMGVFVLGLILIVVRWKY